MRVGSRVTIGRSNDEGSYSYVTPQEAKIGTVIELDHDCNGDGYEFVKSIVIRWDDGMIEKRELQGEDNLGDWEMLDVTPKCYANIYLHDRAYGGPEEGGWWYDTYAPIDGDADWDSSPPPHGHFPAPELAREAMRALAEWCNDQNSRRRSPSSMASEGHFCVRLESWPAEYTPKQRPHYC